MANTHMAASMAMMTWGALEWAFPLNLPFFSGRPTSIGAACGAVVGLVAITPACGYVTIMWGACARDDVAAELLPLRLSLSLTLSDPLSLSATGMFIAFVAAVAVFFVSRNIKFLGVDDRLDVFSFHGVSGMVGTAMTGLFATKSADSPADGAFYGSRGKQFAVQLAGVATTILLCSVGTTVIFHALDQLARALGQDLRIAHSVEDIDASQHGESAYFFESSVRSGGGGEGSVNGGSASSNAEALLAAAAPDPSARPAKHVTIQQN